MLHHQLSRTRRPGRTMVAVVIYLVGFLLLLTLVSHFYLLPATKVYAAADPKTRKLLSADATLILMVILLLLFVGLLITFRVSRFFRPKPNIRNKPTEYVDAWKEAARRLKTPDRDE